jgi:hypothetical protein
MRIVVTVSGAGAPRLHARRGQVFGLWALRGNAAVAKAVADLKST